MGRRSRRAAELCPGDHGGAGVHRRAGFGPPTVAHGAAVVGRSSTAHRARCRAARTERTQPAKPVLDRQPAQSRIPLPHSGNQLHGMGPHGCRRKASAALVCLRRSTGVRNGRSVDGQRSARLRAALRRTQCACSSRRAAMPCPRSCRHTATPGRPGYTEIGTRAEALLQPYSSSLMQSVER